MGCCGQRTAILVVVLVGLALPFAKNIFRALYRVTSYPIDAELGALEVVDSTTLTERLSGKRALVVGGTRGIGRGIANSLARHGAHVSIVGRKGGAEVVNKLKNSAGFESQEFKSYSFDISTVNGAMAACAAIKESDKDSFDFLVMTVGVWPDYDHPKTSDGIDKVIALDVLARFIMMTELANNMRVGGRVMNVLASTAKPPFQPDKDEMKRLITGENDSYSFGNMMVTAMSANDIISKQASKRLSHLKFIGTHPGFVKTELTKDFFPSWFNTLKDFGLSVIPVAHTEEESGDVHSNILTSPLVEKRGASFFSALLAEAHHTTPLIDDAAFGEWLWEFCENMVRIHQ